MKFNDAERLQHFQRFHNWYGLGLLAGFLVINAAVLATSVVMEARRSGPLEFQIWEPFVWEYTSMISILVLIPFLHIYLQRVPFDWHRPYRSVAIYLVIALLFSIAHVTLMISIRKAIYLMLGRTYLFGPLAFEFLYELRKDLVTFILFLTASQSYSFIVSRLISEANLVEEETPTPTVNSRDRLLVKKLGKEFIVKLKDVEWMESSGNYVNLHINERIYPIRKTLGALSEEISPLGFCRIHRSHAVNIDQIESITPFPSGDGEVKMKSGKILNISRRYKDELKQRLI